MSASLTPHWEVLSPELRRLEVPGGWLYQMRDALYGGAAICFVPTPHPTVHYLREDREAVERLNAATDARWRASGFDRKPPP